jgi:hypothetical protein
MTSFAFPLLLSALLTLPAAQDPATPPTPSLADAARAQLEKDATVPKNPTVADLQHRIYDFSVASGDNVPAMVENMQHAAVYGRENVDFPGKKEWAEQMEVAVTHWLGETGPAADRLKAILQENQDALNRSVPGTSQKVRQQWIDALVSYTVWQMRVHQLTLGGQSRSEAAAKTKPH